MLNQPTVDKLRQMRMGAMADALLEQQQDTQLGQLDFEERFGLLVEAEYLARKNRKVTNLLRAAQLRISAACIEDIDCTPERGLAKSAIRQLANCRWIDEHANVILTGPTGVGKTYVACALAQQACRRGYKALYRRVPRLFDEVTLARADGSYPKLLKRVARTHVLVLDDWGLAPLNATKRHDLLEILEDREGLCSTVVTSQLPHDKWHDHIGDPTVADAIMDRVLHNAYKLKLAGPSRRKDKASKEH